MLCEGELPLHNREVLQRSQVDTLPPDLEEALDEKILECQNSTPNSISRVSKTQTIAPALFILG